MTMPADQIVALTVKHLEMVQATVARMSGYGPTFKNYCISVSTAVCGLSITLQRPLLVLLALLPITIFALLDAQYMRLERRYRALFDRVRGTDWQVIPTFEMSLKNIPQVPFLDVVLSWSIVVFYLPLAVGVLAVMLVMGLALGRLV